MEKEMSLVHANREIKMILSGLKISISNLH